MEVKCGVLSDFAERRVRNNALESTRRISDVIHDLNFLLNNTVSLSDIRLRDTSQRLRDLTFIPNLYTRI